MTVLCIKLVSGEEIFGECTDLGQEIQVKSPMTGMVVQDGQLAIVPWLPLAENPVCKIAKTNILLTYTPRAELINKYNSIIGGIVTAPAGALNALRGPNMLR